MGKREKNYMILYTRIRDKIVRGDYPNGDKLPSKRILAEDHGVSVITVQHALELLEDEGYIQARERVGYFVIYRQEDFLTGVSSVSGVTGVSGVSGFAGANGVSGVTGTSGVSGVSGVNGVTGDNYQGQNDDWNRPQGVLDLPGLEDQEPALEDDSGREEEISYSIYAKTVRHVLSEKGESLFQKSPNLGIMELRVAIANYLAKSRNIHVDPLQIVIGSGAEYLYGLIGIMIQGIHTGNETPTIALEDPSYDKIQRIYETHGLSIQKLKMGTEGIETKALQAADTDAMHVTPYNSYPSGVSASASKKREYLHWARERQALIIEDDYDSEFSMLGKSEDTLFSMEPNQTVIYLNTFSKTISSSVRIGYMILPRALTPAFLGEIGYYSCTVPVLEQYVLAELIENGAFQRHLNRVRRDRRRRRMYTSE